VLLGTGTINRYTRGTVIKYFPSLFYSVNVRSVIKLQIFSSIYCISIQFGTVREQRLLKWTEPRDCQPSRVKIWTDWRWSSRHCKNGHGLKSHLTQLMSKTLQNGHVHLRHVKNIFRDVTYKPQSTQDNWDAYLAFDEWNYTWGWDNSTA
jgi:hypothetical protein